jgi:7,8-dihydropterin-6-yl-methyl-4-(beta-D-ribofuranosyl)aminobenzene 5'-phosphate synthase
MKITIVYDNDADAGLKSGWGFSCLIETEEKILFDTGNRGEKLIYNLEQLNIQPESIAAVVISHSHWDHTGGLKEFLKLNNNVKVFHPKSFSEPTEISPGVYSTGALGKLIKEQSLVVNTEKGNILITGCAHPGLAEIIDKAKQLGEIYAVLGGFHGFSKLEKLQRIELIAPCHCTQYKQEMKEKYPVQFMEVKAGSIIEI